MKRCNCKFERIILAISSINAHDKMGRLCNYSLLKQNIFTKTKNVECFMLILFWIVKIS